ncbi:Superkiller protein 3, partial [Borealophlyctis nickersoniae]
MSLKSLLKTAREALNDKNYETARDTCTQILEDIDDKNYNALVFLGLANQNLDKFDDSEKAYRKAIDLNKESLLAYQGLANLFEKTKNNNGLAETLETIRTLHLDAKDAKKCHETTQKLLSLYTTPTHRPNLIRTLRSYTPSSPFYTLLSTLPTIPSQMEIWTRIAEVQEKHDADVMTKEVNSRRQRLGAGPLEVIRRDVEREVVLASQLEEAYEQMIEVARREGEDVGDDVYQKYLEFLYRKLPHVDDVGEREKLHAKIMSQCHAFTTNGPFFPLAFEIRIETLDVAAHDYDIPLLQTAATHVPTSYIGYFAAGYIKWKEGAEVNDVLEDLIASVETNNDTMCGYHILAAVYVENGEWESAVECVEKAKKA